MRFANQGDVKWRDHVLDFLDEAVADPTTSGAWWLNFTSTSGGGLPKTLAAEVNELFTDWLEKQIGAAVAINRLGTIPIQQWAVERVDPSISGYIARGERVRFKSLQQTGDAGKRMYLSAESDGYLGTRDSASDGGPKNLGIEWTIG